MSELVGRNVLHVRLSGGETLQETYYLGPTSECPPLPRVGETVDTEKMSGAVLGLTHAVETIGTHMVYHVEIEIQAERRWQGDDPDRFDRPLR